MCDITVYLYAASEVYVSGHNKVDSIIILAAFHEILTNVPRHVALANANNKHGKVMLELICMRQLSIYRYFFCILSYISGVHHFW